jgi:hypothetical protein
VSDQPPLGVHISELARSVIKRPVGSSVILNHPHISHSLSASHQQSQTSVHNRRIRKLRLLFDFSGAATRGQPSVHLIQEAIGLLRATPTVARNSLDHRAEPCPPSPKCVSREPIRHACSLTKDSVRQTTGAVRVGSRPALRGWGADAEWPPSPTFSAKPPPTTAARPHALSILQIRANIAINLPMAAAAKKRIILGYFPKHRKSQLLLDCS